MKPELLASLSFNKLGGVQLTSKFTHYGVNVNAFLILIFLNNLSELDSDELLSEEEEDNVWDDSLNILIFAIWCDPQRAPYGIDIAFESTLERVFFFK